MLKFVLLVVLLYKVVSIQSEYYDGLYQYPIGYLNHYGRGYDEYYYHSGENGNDYYDYDDDYDDNDDDDDDDEDIETSHEYYGDIGHNYWGALTPAYYNNYYYYYGHPYYGRYGPKYYNSHYYVRRPYYSSLYQTHPYPLGYGYASSYGHGKGYDYPGYGYNK